MKTVNNTRKRKRNRKQKTRKTYKPHQKHIKKKIWKNKEYGGKFNGVRFIDCVVNTQMYELIETLFHSYNNNYNNLDDIIKNFAIQQTKPTLTLIKSGSVGIIFTFKDDLETKKVLKVCQCMNATTYKRLCREVTAGLDADLTSEENPIVPKIFKINGYVSSDDDIKTIKSTQELLNTIQRSDYKTEIKGCILFEQEWCNHSLDDYLKNEDLGCNFTNNFPSTFFKF